MNTTFYQISIAIARALRVFTCFEVTDSGNNKGTISAFESESVWMHRSDDVLLLNPFIKLRTWHAHDLIGEIDKPYMKWDQPEFPNDILGFRYLIDSASNYASKGDFSGREAVKYHATVAFLQKIMGKKMFEWAEKISHESA